LTFSDWCVVVTAAGRVSGEQPLRSQHSRYEGASSYLWHATQLPRHLCSVGQQFRHWWLPRVPRQRWRRRATSLRCHRPGLSTGVTSCVVLLILLTTVIMYFFTLSLLHQCGNCLGVGGSTPPPPSSRLQPLSF